MLVAGAELSGEGRAQFSDSLRGGANAGVGYANGGFFVAASQCSWIIPLSTRTISNQYAG